MRQMKTIAFFVRNIDPGKLPFSVRELYYYSYQEYLLAMKRAGARAYFVTGNDSYLGKGRFARAWNIDKVSEVADFQPVGEITADVVFDKGGFGGEDVVVVTDKRLRPILDDKADTYERFGEYQPKTVVCSNKEELERAMEDMPGTMVAVKSPWGSGGSRVYIGKKGAVEVPAEEIYPLLVQEFVDMSDGIPGIAPGHHDLRLLIAGGKILGATLRQPAKGSFYANVSRGGSERLLSYDEIPAEVREMARTIDGQLPNLPRYYAIDFAKGKQGWILMELNNKPGLFRESNGPLARGFMRALAEYLVELA
jgi:hypothetical protein